MKHYYALILLIFSSLISFAQIITSPTGNVGIGTSDPLQKLTIKSTGTLTGSSSTDYDFGITDGAENQSQLLGLVNSAGNYGLLQVIKGGIGAGNLVMQTQGGNVGIGTTSPTAKISFNNLNDGSNNPDGITWYSPNPLAYGIHRTAGSWNAPNYQQLRLSWDTGIILDPGSLYGKSYVDVQGAGLRVTSGNVGIGTLDTKGYKLAIAGNVVAEAITVKLQGNWPDNVFNKSYTLPTLQETEKHIKEKGHLPGIPSAAEVKANGIDLGEMNAKLLQKIEELTLYLIEQKREIQTLNNKVENLQANQKRY